MISVYADGSSSGGSNRPGGYGFVIVRDGKELLGWGYGGSPATTNNLMEMEGAIQGLLAALDLGLGKGELIELVSDSQYTLGIAGGAYQPVANLESATKLRELAVEVGCRFRWVRGHAGEQFNEYCDKLAKQGKIENTSEEVLQKRAAKKQRSRQRAANTPPGPVPGEEPL